MAPQHVAPFFEPSAPPLPMPLLTCQTNLSNVPRPNPTITISESLSTLSRAKHSHGSHRVRSAASHARSPSPYVKPASKAKPGKGVTFSSLASSSDCTMRPRSPGSELSELSDLSSHRSSSEPPSDSDSGLILKPLGEVGRPHSGGYSLEKALNWDPRSYAKLRASFFLASKYP
jgi:hypothetical protein